MSRATLALENQGFDLLTAHFQLPDALLRAGYVLAAPPVALVPGGRERVEEAQQLPAKGVVGGGVDGRADVYSLAAVIFETTTGRRPFSSKSWIETLSRRLYEPPPNVCEVIPELPAPKSAAEVEKAQNEQVDKVADRLAANIRPALASAIAEQKASANDAVDSGPASRHLSIFVMIKSSSRRY